MTHEAQDPPALTHMEELIVAASRMFRFNIAVAELRNGAPAHLTASVTALGLIAAAVEHPEWAAGVHRVMALQSEFDSEGYAEMVAKLPVAFTDESVTTA